MIDEYKKETEPAEASEETAEAYDDIEVGDELPEDEAEDSNVLTVYIGKNEIPLSDKDYNDLIKWLTKRAYI